MASRFCLWNVGKIYQTLCCHIPEDSIHSETSLPATDLHSLTSQKIALPSITSVGLQQATRPHLRDENTFLRNVSKFPNDAVTSQRIESSSESSANFYQTMWRHIRGDSSLRFIGVCIF
jgi:hypothetical protein